MRRWLTFAVVLFGLFLAFASARTLYEGWHEYHVGMRLQRQHRQAQAVMHLTRAARWYFPLFGADGRAIDALYRTANTLLHQGKRTSALALFREIRASILVSRSLYTPHKRILSLCEQHIATLMSKGDAQARQHYLAQLRNHIQPNPWFSLLAVLTFLSWLFFSGWGFFYSVTRDGTVRWTRLGLTVVGSIGLLGLLLLFLRLA